ncbi:hydrolase [Pseudomonas aeruginosa]|nr:hydrolase [Pseudomonas aeruginosa]
MSATPYLLQPPLAVGFARLGFGSLSLESLRERYAAPSSGSRFIELDGFPLHYRDEGSRDKPVLVMIHGVVASLHTWDDWGEGDVALLPHRALRRAGLRPDRAGA